MRSIVVGDKIRAMWPKNRPMMCVVGHVESTKAEVEGFIASVRFDDDHPPCDVNLDRAKVYIASKKAVCGLFMRKVTP